MKSVGRSFQLDSTHFDPFFVPCLFWRIILRSLFCRSICLTCHLIMQSKNIQWMTYGTTIKLMDLYSYSRAIIGISSYIHPPFQVQLLLTSMWRFSCADLDTREAKCTSYFKNTQGTDRMISIFSLKFLYNALKAHHDVHCYRLVNSIGY